MLWRIRILRDVMFFVKMLRKWCVCMYMCVIWKFGNYLSLLDAMLSLFGG